MIHASARSTISLLYPVTSVNRSDLYIIIFIIIIIIFISIIIIIIIIIFTIIITIIIIIIINILLSILYIYPLTKMYYTELSSSKIISCYPRVNEYPYNYRHYISHNSQCLRQCRIGYLSGRVVSGYIWKSIRLSSRDSFLYEKAKSTAHLTHNQLRSTSMKYFQKLILILILALYVTIWSKWFDRHCWCIILKQKFVWL